MKEAKFYKAGHKIVSTGFVFKNDCYTMRINELKSNIRSLL